MAILAAAGIVLTAAVQISRLIEAPVWLFVILYALAALFGVIALMVGLRKKRDEENRAWVQEVTGYLTLGPGRSGWLPRVSEVSPYRLGTSRSTYAPDDTHRNDPYVHREVDARLREVISSHEFPFVIIVGDSKAGKSRTAFEAILAELPGAALIVPTNVEAIDKLFSLDPPLDLHPAPAVLWLDDLDEATLGALTPGLLDRLDSEVIVVASMTSERRDRIARSDSDIGRTARIALDRAKEIPLSAELTDEERGEALARYPRERFDHSIGEPLVAADLLTAKFNAGRTSNSVGHALVRVAIDWRRAGVGRPILESELRALYPQCLPSIRVGLEPSSELYQEGLAWACEPLVSHVALLERSNADKEHGFVAFDYLVALLDGQHEGYPGRDVLPVIWNFVTDFLSEEEAMSVGLTAYLRSDLTGAEHIWRYLAEGSSTYSTEAVFNLGISLAEQGNPDGAREAFQRAIDSDHPNAAPRAALNLGALLIERGDDEGARVAFQRVIDSGHPDQAPKAAISLGALLVEQGDFVGARVVFEQAIHSSHPDAAPDATLRLGALLVEQGDPEAAREALQQAINSDDLNATPDACLFLGALLAEQGNTDGAREAFQQAIDSGHPAVAPEASLYLGNLLEEQGDTAGARHAYEMTINSGHHELGPIARNLMRHLR
ncbi:MAG: tetratricopeptide repeat protein [Rubrobacter sp.]|nr:tetratricopeptide repeat protein [Rubrobacter sp.]